MKILIASSIDADTIRELEKAHDVICAFSANREKLLEVIPDSDILVFRSGVQITNEILSAASNLKFIIRAGSGVDNIDLNYVREHDIPMLRVPGPGAKAVAEMSFGLMLGLARNILIADKLWRQGHWQKHALTGYSLTGKRLGIVGAGNIGERVGRLGAAWDMEVIGCVEHMNADSEARLAESGIRMAEFDEVISTSDFISIHVPLKESTRNLIDAEALAKMKSTAYLVNLARGGVVDEEALLKALTDGKLRGAALDVHKNEGEGKISPLAGLDNVILTPHIGAGSFDSQREIGEIVLDAVNKLVAEQH